MATKTLDITNFSGRLSRIINGDINSGFAKFDTSWGYDPFSKPGNLTWFETPGSIFGVQDVVMGGLSRVSNSNSSILSTFLVGNTGKVYQVQVRSPIIEITQGPFSPSSVVISSAVGTRTWGGPTSVFTLDSLVTSAVLNPGTNPTSHYIIPCNFGFAVPADSQIRGVTATVFRTQTAGTPPGLVKDNVISLAKNLLPTGDNRAVSTTWSESSIQSQTYGGPTDLWGTTLSPADINSANFGLAISATAPTGSSSAPRIDYVSMEVSYGNNTTDSVIGIASVATTFNYGAGMSFYGVTEKLYLGSDDRILVTGSVIGNSEFTLNGQSSTVALANVVGNAHPLKTIAGSLAFGNGPSIGLIDETGIVTSSIFTVNTGLGNQYSRLFPPLPNNQQVRDLDLSPDANYLKISATAAPPENLVLPGGDSQVAAPSEGGIYEWNGIDQGITKFTTVPSGTSTALQIYLQNNLIFLNDAFGTSVSDGVTKLLTLPGNKSPVPNATTFNGNFLSWMAPEYITRGYNAGTRPGSLYYFGSLDQENPSGLYRLYRHFAFEKDLTDGFVYQIPFNTVVSNKYITTNSSITGLTAVSYGKHFFSTYNVSSTASATTADGTHALYSFLITPTGFGYPLSGVYETQTQLFSKRISTAQIRVYCDPTVVGNGFQLEAIGADGEAIENGTYTYTYGDIIDPQSGSLSVERVNFPGNIKSQFSLGIRISNTGSTNMVIKKVEVDYSEEGK